VTYTEIDPAWTIRAGENSYVSMDDADAIASTRLFASAWTNATEPTRVQALVTATALLDRMRWQGRPVAPTQPLAWPRVPERCPHGFPMQTQTPAAIVTACVELAMHLLSQGQLAGAPVMQRMLGDSMTMYLIEPHLRVSSANVAEVML
jgi:hypothetical protein